VSHQSSIVPIPHKAGNRQPSIGADEFKSILKKFSQLKILVIGDVMLDAYVWGTAERISPEAPVPVVDVEKMEERLGGAANVAMNVNALGATPVLCSLIGHDYAGEKVLGILKSHQMKTDGIIQLAGRITGIKTRVLSKSHHLLRFDMESTSDLDKEEEQQFLKILKTLIAKEKPHAVILEDYNKGVLTENIINSVIKLCRDKKILTAVDPKKKNFFAYKNADIFKPNLREVREAFNHEMNVSTESSLQQVHAQLKKKIQHKITLITLGDHGIFYSDGKQSGIIPAYKRDISDVSGAGDTVIAVATLAIAGGMKLNDAASIANLAGGMVCEYAGVIPVTKEMLSKEIELTNNQMNEQ